MAGNHGPVLIVEDNEDQRDLTGIFLRRAGYHVAYASDGRDAWHRLESGLRPCVIVLDLAMPRMDGFEFRRRQMADARFSDIPVVIVSAIRTARQIREEMGVEGVQKPFDPETMVRLIASHC